MILHALFIRDKNIYFPALGLFFDQISNFAFKKV